MSRIVTVEDVLALDPCEASPEARLREVLGAGLPLGEAVLHPDVPREDRLWLATRWPAHHDRELMARWLEVVVGRAVRRHALECGVPEVEAWARRWLDGDAKARGARAARAASELASELGAERAASAAWAAWAAAEAWAWAAAAAWAAARCAEVDWALERLAQMAREEDAPDLPALRELIDELEAATLPELGAEVPGGGRVVLGWRPVRRPDVVSAWLGPLSLWVDDPREGLALSDPEAAGWAVDVARALRAGAHLEPCRRWYLDAAPDDACRDYVRAVLSGWSASTEGGS